MKLKSLFSILAMSLCSAVFAGNIHYHSAANSGLEKATAANVMSPGYCQIELINDSYIDVRVYGEFDDRSALIPFTMPARGRPQYISLSYNGWCHDGMYLTIMNDYSGERIYDRYTAVYNTIHITPYGTGKEFRIKLEPKAH